MKEKIIEIKNNLLKTIQMTDRVVTGSINLFPPVTQKIKEFNHNI
jgi:hypothetical protein